MMMSQITPYSGKKGEVSAETRKGVTEPTRVNELLLPASIR